jgi:hypothetical protein
MSSAADALQRALVATLRAAPFATTLTGIFDGPPADAACPYLAISDGSTTDWSHKSGQGREHRLSVAIWDSDIARLHRLVAAAEDAIATIPRALDGHAIISLAFLRSRLIRTTEGPWAGRLDYRVRTLET